MFEHCFKHYIEEVNTIAIEYTIEPAGAKVELVSELRALVGLTTAAILTDYRGLSVAELTELRKKLRDADAEYRVVKNTLFKLAAGDSMPIAEMGACSEPSICESRTSRGGVLDRASTWAALRTRPSMTPALTDRALWSRA